jgi:hypothetical protein
MRPRHAILLTPLDSADPVCLLISIINAPVTPLKSALTAPSQLTENTATLSPTESALTRLSRVTPLESALTKNTRGGGPSFPTQHSPLATPHATQVLSFHILAHSFAFFCTQAKLNSFIFNRFHTLWEKHVGWERGPSSDSTSHRSRSTDHGSRNTDHDSPSLLTSLPRHFVTSSLPPVSALAPTGLTRPTCQQRRTRGTFRLPRRRERTGRQQDQTGCHLPR